MVRHRLRVLDERAVALDEGLVAVGVDRHEIRERGVAADGVFRRPSRRSRSPRSRWRRSAACRGSGPGSCTHDRTRRRNRRPRWTAPTSQPEPLILLTIEPHSEWPSSRYSSATYSPPFFFDQDLADLGHLARIDVVRSDDEELLLAEGLDDPGDEVRELLVRHGAGVDDVLRALEAFVIGRIEVHGVALLEHRQHRLAARRGVGAEHGRQLVLDDELRGLLVVGLRIGGAVLQRRPSTCLPMTPPEALISVIAIIVASCSDFSMIERPPVSENSTPTRMRLAGRSRSGREDRRGVASAAAPNTPACRNLRLSIAMIPLPCVQRTRIVRAEARCAEPKSPDQTGRRKRRQRRRRSRSEKQKSQTDPRGSFGLPSRCQTSNIDGPTAMSRSIALPRQRKVNAPFGR